MPEFDPSRYTLTARWVFPVSGPPLQNGVIEIDSGRITAVHNHAPKPGTVNCGNVALLPELVNAHTHLEFSDLQQPVQPALPFTEWIKSLVGVRRGSPATAAVIQQGLAECRAAGTTQIGEIATQDWPSETYQHTGIRTVVFRELIGLSSDRAAVQLEIARQWLSDPGQRDDTVTRGLSPHAPYSVGPDLYRDLVNLAVEQDAPVAVHLAETLAELELLDCGTGEFVDMLQRFNAWDSQIIPRGTRPLDYLQPLASVSRGLVIHGNYLASAEFDWLETHPRITVVYCPRTHAYFQHPPHPWKRLLDRGINVALGTDSRGSNPDLSLWREMQFLAMKFPEVDPNRILAMGTLYGSRALGCDSELGTLEPGKLAQVVCVPLPEAQNGDSYRLLFAGQDPMPLGWPTS